MRPSTVHEPPCSKNYRPKKGKKTRSLTTELEAEKTRVKQCEREKKELEKKVSQLASKIAAHNIEAGDAYSTTTVAQGSDF